MRAHTQQTALAASLLLLPLFTSAMSLDCSHVLVDSMNFDLSPLAGVHEISHAEEFEGYTVNTTYVLNICNTLKGAARRGGLNCGTTRNICGFENIHFLDEDEIDQNRTFPIAGMDHLGSGNKDAEITRLKKLDPSTEGVRVKLSGGRIIEEAKPAKPASAVIDFQCDPDRTGLEGLKNDDELDQEKKRRLRRDDDEEGDDDDDDKEDGDDEDKPKDNDRSLQFKYFGLADDKKSYVLRLDWRTKHACENGKRDDSPVSNGGSHWGFFTWLIIILFLCVAAYLIFGSWLNYNRHGARGWDLLPHADTVRDIPYIFQDWMRRVLGTLQGSGSRGGYAAV